MWSDNKYLLLHFPDMEAYFLNIWISKFKMTFTMASQDHPSSGSAGISHETASDAANTNAASSQPVSYRMLIFRDLNGGIACMKKPRRFLDEKDVESQASVLHCLDNAISAYVTTILSKPAYYDWSADSSQAFGSLS